MKDSTRQRIHRKGKRPDLDLIYRVRLNAEDETRVEEILREYRAQADVQYAERNPIVSICAEPDDPLFDTQWALEKIAAVQAWNTCQGSAEVVVAVIDTGVDYRHRDLAANAWHNEAELNGIPGRDDDENGYVDDIWGYNFIYNNAEPTDDQGHGTHCAGIIAAAGDNGLDVSGVCWKARIMPVKILGSDGDGNSADGAVAVYYAVANGADVISCSWGGPEPSELLAEALAYAHSQGVLLVAAAGNEDTDELFYPASYPDIIAVAATGPNDQRWAFSNHGEWVDVAAPGQAIISLRSVPTSGRGQSQYTVELSGTSMAAPHVAGAAALLLSANPLLTTDEVREMLLSTGDPIAMGICASDARVNVAQALQAAIPNQGMVRLDRQVYGQGADIGILLADWDLRGARTQAVAVESTSGDVETVHLAESTASLGVFRATVATDSGAPAAQDGGLQVRHGEDIVVRYEDADAGFADGDATVQAVARMDAEPPAVVETAVMMAGPVARVAVLATEPATAQIRYAPVDDDADVLTAAATDLREFHRVTLGGLRAGAEYRFVIELVDAGGNEVTADNAGAGYTFLADVDANGFRVPEVYPTIQAAVDDAWDGDTIWVADGTYAGPGNIEVDLRGKAIAVRSENGPATCVIDCQGKGSAFYIHSGEDTRTVVDGFTVRNGYNDFGGGLLCAASSPTITNCIFRDNKATRFGGGLCNWYAASPTITNCRFERNTCMAPEGRGGGMANRRDCRPVVQNCTFIENDAPYAGGGLDNYDESHARVLDCHFESNTAGYGGAVTNWYRCRATFKRCTFEANQGDKGGAVHNRSGSDPTFEQCLFFDNVAAQSGGAMLNFETKATLLNCTIAANRADLTGGGIDGGRRTTIYLANSIVWGNTDGAIDSNSLSVERAQLMHENARITVDYCCVEGWAGTFAGLGTFGRDPLFVDATDGDFHLRSAGLRWDDALELWVTDAVTSPCIDAGHPGWTLGDERLTWPDDPNVPVNNPRVNLGAYGRTDEASIAPAGWMLLADLTNDGVVDWRDLAGVTDMWLLAGDRQAADLNHDGVVDVTDLADLAQQWRGVCADILATLE
ncbi:MAG: S8 family serine peptidase [Phycisphaerales bacterium]|nr:MAG: S8 family serine peptidase [Phycisphaerales bacterium]